MYMPGCKSQVLYQSEKNLDKKITPPKKVHTSSNSITASAIASVATAIIVFFLFLWLRPPFLTACDSRWNVRFRVFPALLLSLLGGAIVFTIPFVNELNKQMASETLI